MKYVYYPIVFFQDSEEVNKITNMIDEGTIGLDRAFSYMRQWETGEEEGSETIPYGSGDTSYWTDVDNTLSYVVSYRYGLYVSLTRVETVKQGSYSLLLLKLIVDENRPLLVDCRYQWEGVFYPLQIIDC